MDTFELFRHSPIRFPPIIMPKLKTYIKILIKAILHIKAWPEARLINFLHALRWCDDTYNFAVLIVDYKTKRRWMMQCLVFLSSNFFMLKWMTCQKLIFCVGLCVIKIAWTLNSSVYEKCRLQNCSYVNSFGGQPIIYLQNRLRPTSSFSRVILRPLGISCSLDDIKSSAPWSQCLKIIKKEASGFKIFEFLRHKTFIIS